MMLNTPDRERATMWWKERPGLGRVGDVKCAAGDFAGLTHYNIISSAVLASTITAFLQGPLPGHK